MVQANISTLKTHLSRYLDQVRAGEQVLVSDRNQAVAVIVPFQAGAGGEWSSRISELARLGRIAVPLHEVGKAESPVRPRRKKRVDLSEAIIEERRSAR